MTELGHWLRSSVAQLQNSNTCDTPELDAQLIVCSQLGISRARIIGFPETPIAESDRCALDALLQRRLRGEPLAYITGEKEFWSMRLSVSPDTLVPRADTESLVDKALELSVNAPEGLIAELGTGTGAIAIAVASELPLRKVIAIEKHAPAIEVARANIAEHGHGRIQLLQGSWLEALSDNSVAMVLANPPYLADDDEHLPDLVYEPRTALVAGSNALADIELIVRDSTRAACAGAPLILEHGYTQGEAVRTLLLDYSYTTVGTSKDLAGLDRITFGINTK